MSNFWTHWGPYKVFNADTMIEVKIATYITLDK